MAGLSQRPLPRRQHLQPRHWRRPPVARTRRGWRPPTPSAPERRVQPRLTFAPVQARDTSGPRGSDGDAPIDSPVAPLLEAPAPAEATERVDLAGSQALA
eukprot:12617025-Alexandrium_andersonii.AAC.1